MLKHGWVLLILSLIQFGCGYKTDTLSPSELPSDAIARFQSLKRDFLQIEDLKIGTGPLAAWNRRIEATLDVRSTDGAVIYKGPTFYYEGFVNLPDTSVYDEKHLGGHPGIKMGINGMAVGGKRRITIDPRLVCTGDDTYCSLVGPGNSGKTYHVRREALIAEVTLTDSCIPTRLSIFIWNLFAWTGEVVCWDQDTPQVASGDPIWRFY